LFYEFNQRLRFSIFHNNRDGANLAITAGTTLNLNSPQATPLQAPQLTIESGSTLKGTGSGTVVNTGTVRPGN